MEYGSDPLSLENLAHAVPSVFVNSCAVSRALHDVSITAKPGQNVYYRVSSGGKLWSAVYTLTTPQPQVPDFTFSLMGDMGINCGVRCEGGGG